MNKRGHVLNAVLLAVALGFVLEPAGDLTTFRTIAAVFVPLVLGALFPDVDTHFGKHRKTLHNVFVLGIVVAYPFFFDNLHWVWLGVLTHYALDVFGTTRGIALFYPLWDEEYGIPVGVPVGSNFESVMTLVVTAFEITLVVALVHVLPPYLPTEAAQVLGV